MCIRDSDKVILLSRTLDRNGKREQAGTDVVAIDTLQPEARFKLTALPGAGWRVLRWQDRGNRLVLSEYVSSTVSKLWLLDLATGKRTELGTGSTPVAENGDRWLYRKRLDGDFTKLSRVDLKSGDRQWVTKDIENDVDDWSVTKGGKRVAVLVNANGYNQLKLYDGELRSQPTPSLPTGLILSLIHI